MRRTPDRVGRMLLKRGPEVAHDIASPLNSILINAGLVRAQLEGGGGDHASELERLAAIELETGRARRMIEAFLDAAAAPAGEDGEFDIVGLAKLLALRFGARFDCELSGMQVSGCEELVRQMMRSLLEGAARLSGGTVELVSLGIANGAVCLRISGLRDAVGRAIRFSHAGEDGKPDTALAEARTIAETLGGSLREAALGIELVLPLENE